MAYNFLCETTTEPNWEKLNKLLRKYNQLESFPILEATDEKLNKICAKGPVNTGLFR